MTVPRALGHNPVRAVYGGDLNHLLATGLGAPMPMMKYEDAPYYKPKVKTEPDKYAKVVVDGIRQTLCHYTQPQDPFPTDSVKEAVRMGLDGMVFLRTLGARILEVIEGLDDRDVDLYCPHGNPRVRGSYGRTVLYFCDGCWDAYRFHHRHEIAGREMVS